MYMIARLLKALNSDSGAWSLAFAVAFGMVLGLTPTVRLHNLVLLLLVMVLRVHLGLFLLSFLLFSAIALLLDPAMISLGESLLTLPALESSWTALYDTALGRLSQFNHTLTAGSLTVSLLLFLPLAWLSHWLVVQYREKLMTAIKRLKIVEFLRSSRLYKVYQQLEQNG